jgi:uncharacterized protein (DUF58 family)
MNRFWLLFVLATVDFLVALILRNGAVAVLAVPLLIYLAAGLQAMPENVSIDAVQVLDQNLVNPGDPVNAIVTITNHGSRIDELEVHIPLNPGLDRIEGPAAVLTQLAPEQTGQFALTFTGSRGVYKLPDIEVVTRDVFGLFSHSLSLPQSGRVTIPPSPDRLRRLPIRPLETRGFAGPIPSRLGGSGTDFFDVREYQLGDPLRRVNWRITARQNRGLYTNDYELERTANVGLILDARQSSNIEIGQDTIFEYSIAAIAALAAMFLNDGNRVGLLTYGYGMEWVFPGYGKVQQDRILRALAKAETGHNFSLDSLENLPVRLFPAKSQIVMVSPLSQSDAETLVRLRARGYEVLMICPDPISFELKKTPHIRADDPAVRLARIERRLVVNQLKQSGIQLLNWDVDLPLEQILRSAQFYRGSRLNLSEKPV